jgi:hypothetical protein
VFCLTIFEKNEKFFHGIICGKEKTVRGEQGRFGYRSALVAKSGGFIGVT